MRWASNPPPFSIPASQRYFWTQEWQDGEREVDEALARGDFVTFDSDDPEDVVRWLCGE